MQDPWFIDKCFIVIIHIRQTPQSNVDVTCTNQTVFVNESSTEFEHTFPVKNKSSGILVDLSFSALLVTFLSLSYRLIVN